MTVISHHPKIAPASAAARRSTSEQKVSSQRPSKEIAQINHHFYVEEFTELGSCFNLHKQCSCTVHMQTHMLPPRSARKSLLRCARVGTSDMTSYQPVVSIVTRRSIVSFTPFLFGALVTASRGLYSPLM